MESERRVLLLLGDPEERNLLTRLCAELNLESRVGHDPVRLIAKLAEEPRPHIAILEQRYPHTTAIELLSAFLRDPEWCLVPIVLVLASATPHSLKGLRRLPVPPEVVMGRPISVSGMRAHLGELLAAPGPLQRAQRQARERRAREIHQAILNSKMDVVRLRLDREIEQTQRQLDRTTDRRDAQVRILNARMNSPVTREKLLAEIAINEEELRSYHRALEGLEEARRRFVAGRALEQGAASEDGAESTDEQRTGGDDLPPAKVA